MPDDALAFARATRWQRQGNWGGSTLSRTLTYCGLQLRLQDWTGVGVGFEAFLHSGETTYIAEGQFPRFADAYLEVLSRERRPLASFEARFDRLLDEVRALLADLQSRPTEDDLARYVRLHMEMQPYSYVFGYGEESIVGELVRRAVADRPDARELARAAFAPPQDAEATRLLRDAPELLQLTRRQAVIRTDRRILWNRVDEAAAPLVAKAAARQGIPERLAQELTPRELLENAAPASGVVASRLGGTFLAWRGIPWLFSGDAHRAVESSLTAEGPAVREVLEGLTGHPGFARGRVRIVLTPEQGDTLRKGEILVSDMTTPDLAVACGKAAAIVTDRGGMLCHAAIVSRELGIPCVLGTEHATRSLRDGDLVEVDAARGVVRVLERA